MDSKEAFRSRTREAARKRVNKIVSPLIRYNDLGQPVCKVCNITLKSEALWVGHSASRQHKAAVDEFKAKAAALTGQKRSASSSASVVMPSELPDDFLDKPASKRSNSGSQVESLKPPVAKSGISSSAPGSRTPGQPVNVKPETQRSSTHDSEQLPAAQGTLPEGFFDNQTADSRARGVEPVKLDIQHEYGEFQKLIEVDVKEVDARLEEEEFEAAEEREEHNQIEQRSLTERINLYKKIQQEKVAAGAKTKAIQLKLSENWDDKISDESDDEDNILVDWRAKHYWNR